MTIAKVGVVGSLVISIAGYLAIQNWTMSHLELANSIKGATAAVDRQEKAMQYALKLIEGAKVDFLKNIVELQKMSRELSEKIALLRIVQAEIKEESREGKAQIEELQKVILRLQEEKKRLQDQNKDLELLIHGLEENLKTEATLDGEQSKRIKVAYGLYSQLSKMLEAKGKKGDE